MSLTARITALAQAVGADIKTALAHIGSRGPAHGVATTSEAGFLSATDKTKLDSMSEGASGDANAAVATHAGAADPHGVTYPITPGGYAVGIIGSDLNSLYRTGFYRGYGLVHAPLDNGGWWHVLIASGDANWVKQTATAFGAGNNAGDIYERVRNNGAWTSWAKVYKGTDVYPVAASLGSGASINGKVFSGLENIRVAESIHSVRDCTLGTLIETSIDYTGFNGDPFLLRITGNTYSRLIPVDISVQGYIHNSSLIQYGGISTGSVISGLVALLYNGHLCFWFPYQSYWEGYDVSVITARPDQNVNKVISIQNAAMPADAARVVGLSSHIRQAITRGEAIDGAAIGQTTPAAGAFSTLSAIGTVTSSAGYHTTSTSDTAYKLTKKGVLAAKVKITSGGLVIGVDGTDGDTPIGTFSSSSGLSVAGALSASGSGTFGGSVSAGGLSLGGNTLALNESGVRSWQLQATGGNARLSSGDGNGAFVGAGDGTMDLGAYNKRWRDLHASRYVVAGTPYPSASPAYHVLSGTALSAGDIILSVYDGIVGSVQFRYGGSSGSPAFISSSAVLNVGLNINSGRSIDATGTINANGADYAEHEQNNGHRIIKGQIVGFDADGKLTTQFSEALRFAVKSTEPGYTGGNTWMDSLPPRPNKPVLHDVQRRSYGEADEVNPDAEVDALIEQEYQEALVAAEIEYQSELAQYERDKTAFDKAMAEAVSKVDRIAYCGKVPVNYQGADAGQYLIAKAMPDDSIGCYAVYDPTFQEYLHCIGRVNKVLPDGRAEIAVIIH